MQTGAIMLMMLMLYVLWEFSVKDNTDLLIKDALMMAESDLSESFNTGLWNIFNMLQVELIDWLNAFVNCPHTMCISTFC
jgi:amino acid permease